MERPSLAVVASRSGVARAGRRFRVNAESAGASCKMSWLLCGAFLLLRELD